MALRCRDNDTVQDFHRLALRKSNHTNGVIIRLVEAVQVATIIHSCKTRMWGKLEFLEAWYRLNLYAHLG
jgi:hypothetical protein